MDYTTSLPLFSLKAPVVSHVVSLTSKNDSTQNIAKLLFSGVQPMNVPLYNFSDFENPTKYMLSSYEKKEFCILY